MARDELELRIAAHELALVEIAAAITPSALLYAIEAIRDGLAGAFDDDEHTIRAQAMLYLEEALERGEPFSQGLAIRRAS